MRRLIPLLVLTLWAGEALAGAWTQPEGAGFYKLGSQMVRGQEFRDMGRNRQSIPTLADYTVSLYGEYGLRDGLTLIAYVPFYKRITLNRQVGRPSGFVYFEGDDVHGIADAQAGLRYRLAALGATVVSAGLLLGVPLGDDAQANGLLTGDGEVNQVVSLQLGHSLYPVPAYVNAEVGYSNRLKGYSDEFIYSVEAGYTVGDRLTAVLRLRGIESMENGDDGTSGGMGGLYANNQRYTTFGPELIYAIDERIGVSVSAMGTARVQNALTAPVYSFGVFVRR